MTDLRLFNSLTRKLEPFQPVHPGEARVYSCGPTVYNYQHIGNMRAYVFADTLGRTLQFKGYRLTHVINITDVGHLTSDADAGEDKMEKMAAQAGKSAWDIARFYQEDFERDLARLNVQKKAHPRATEYVEAMIEWGRKIAPKHCYELDSGLYFDVTTVADYGKLARAVTEDGEGRIETVEGKRNAADFAIWRKTPPGETRQMEWDSPWGRGAPGWHLECSVMGGALLGFPFDIHTGGIDHREIHHPNEIAQNQAYCCTNGLSDPQNSGAKIWMHNNFLVERSGKMSKSSGEFLRLQLLIDKGYHPLAYRMLCLQAHYRSELEFSWEGLQAALVRLKRLSRPIAELTSYAGNATPVAAEEFSDKLLQSFDESISQDLKTPQALTFFEALALNGAKSVLLNNPDYPEIVEAICAYRLRVLEEMDRVLGLDILGLSAEELRIRPKAATITEPEIEAILAQRKEARAAKDFATSDRLRDELAGQGVEVMDGDPLGWDWKLG
ncbi:MULTISPECIES: cysteine--tRNA ligase [unclassified Novosphingobium]|uniref:cysteine--tRNA ligase n=1 Tax=unclassified Novosphingobium TaxID=2644732 RepID=UPI0025EFEA29|nr:MULTISPECIES: cysteine--tRNA ligase [unclassified Novosphingobium]HQV03992.1 cysteine--tRNA ligase [Novosphingobium sp.]